MSNKLSPCNILCIFMGYSSPHKGFCSLDPTVSRLYITRHTQFNETHFHVVPSSQAQPIFSSHISNFLELRLYHIDQFPLPLLYHTLLDPTPLCVIFVLTLWMSLCRFILILEVPLCHPWLLICPLLNLWLILLLFGLSSCDHTSQIYYFQDSSSNKS